MLFDTHAHMNDPAFDEDREEMILGLRDRGTEFVMNVGCCLESSKDCIALAEKYPFVYASVGSHPDSADEVSEEVIEAYRQMAQHPKVPASQLQPSPTPAPGQLRAECAASRGAVHTQTECGTHPT